MPTSLAEAYNRWLKGGRNANLDLSGFGGTGGVGGSGSKKKAEPAPAQSPLNWIIDMASRPLYGVTKALSGNIGRAEKVAQSFASDAPLTKKISDAAGSFVKAASPITNLPEFWTGLTSTDEKDKKTGSDIIDEIGTVSEAAQGRKYQKPDWEKDKGGTIARGVGGFALDVALDPITYIPFANIVKGAKTAIQAGKKAGKAIEEGGDVAKALLADEVKAGAKSAPKAANVAEDAPTLLSRIVADAAPKTKAAAQPVSQAERAAATKANLVMDAAVPDAVGESVAKQLLAAPNLKVAGKITPPARAASSAVETPEYLARLSKIDQAAGKALSGVGKGSAKPTPAEAANVAERAAQAASDVPAVRAADFARTYEGSLYTTVANGGRKASIDKPRIIQALENPRAPENQQILAAFQRSESGQKFAAALASARGVPAVSKTAPKAAAAKLTTLQQILKGTEEGAALREAIGEDAAKALTKRGIDPAEQRGILEDFQRLSRPDELTPDTFGSLHPAVRRFADNEMQLTPENFDAAVRDRWRAKSAAELAGAPSDNVMSASARSMPDATAREIAEVLGVHGKDAWKEMRADGTATLRAIVGSEFDPSKVVREGRVLKYSGKDVSHSVYEHELNSFKMTTYFTKAAKLAEDAAEVAGIANPASRAAFKRREVLRRLTEVDAKLTASGIYSGVRVGDDFVPLLTSDAIQAVQAATRNAAGEGVEDLVRAADRMFFNQGTAVPFSNFLEAAGRAALGQGDDAIAEALLRTKAVSGKQFRNPLVTGGRGGYTLQAPKAVEAGTRLVPNPKGKKGFFVEYEGSRLLHDALTLVREAAPQLREMSKATLGAHVAKSVEDAGAVAARLEGEFAEALAKGAGVSTEFLAGIQKRAADLTQELGGSPLSAQMVGDQLAKMLPERAVPTAEGIRAAHGARDRVIDRARKVHAEPKVTKEALALQDTRHTPVYSNSIIEADQVVQALKDEGAAFMGVGTGVDRVIAQNANLFNRMWDPLGQLFDVKHGSRIGDLDLHELYRGISSTSGRFTAEMGAKIAQLQKRFNTRIGATEETLLSAAFKELQQGTRQLGPEALRTDAGRGVQAALDELVPVMNNLFDMHGAGASGDLFFRNSMNVRFLEDSMRHYGMSRYSEVPFDDMLTNGALEDAWKTWKVDSPAEFLTQYVGAATRALGMKGASDSLIGHALRSGYASRTAKSGYGLPRLEGRSYMFAGLQDSKLHFREDFLRAVSELDKQILAVTTPNNSFVPNVFDPVTRAWKTGMTIYRTGHHIRNVVSNGALSFVAEGSRNLAKSGKVALDVLARRHNAAVPEAGEAVARPAIEKVLRGEQQAIKRPDSVAFTVGRGARKRSMTFGEIANQLERGGVFRTYQKSEDLVRDERGILNTIADKVTLVNTRFGKAVGAGSEMLDHHGFAQQAIQIVMNNLEKVGGKRFRTEQDLWDHAIARAYRFHPDSDVLSSFEKKYMRRLIPFYTWFRGTLPAVVESTWQYPGRVAMFHKASFGAAQSMGIDAESFANPFPEDAAVPDFLREKVFGANFRNPWTGEMFGMNPGFAHQDLASEFFGRGPEQGDGAFKTPEQQEADRLSPPANLFMNAVRMLGGMTNPVIRVPLELLTGTKLQDGKKITSADDYLDSTIPGVNYLSKLTGLSTVGSIRTGGPKVRQNVERGYDSGLLDENGNFAPGATQSNTVLNWLFGQGAVKVKTKQQDEAEKKARKEQKAAEKRAAEG